MIPGGFHLSGRSDGTSLVVLPQQFSHCLRARDDRVRIVRADLLMAGVIFSGDVDTDILFDYGIFRPGCRRGDLADMRRLRGEHRIARLALERRSPVPGLERYRRETSGGRECPQIAIATIAADRLLAGALGNAQYGAHSAPGAD